MHDALLVNLKFKTSKEDEEKMSISSVNLYLTTLIEKQDKKIIDLENTCDALKKYKHMVKSCSNMDCKGCTRGFSPSLFSAHIVICKKIEWNGFSV